MLDIKNKIKLSRIIKYVRQTVCNFCFGLKIKEYAFFV